jgi:hypothetical protein
MKRVLVNGGAGFIGASYQEAKKRRSLDRSLDSRTDLKCIEFGDMLADEFMIADLTDPPVVRDALEASIKCTYLRRIWVVPDISLSSGTLRS